MDSLYLVVEYPHADLFHLWSQGLGDLHDPRLYEGIVYQEMLLRKGSVGYTFSVWEGDARLFLTERVTETSPHGQSGMGVMLQLGPQWLNQYADLKDADQFRANIYRQLARFGMINPQEYPARLNRIDLALDVIGWYTGQFSVDEWQQGWVGYAKPRHLHFSQVTGQIEGLSVGSYDGAVRFKFYDKLQESLKNGTNNFWREVWGIPEDEHWHVTRFEWSFKPYKAHFSELQYLSDYSFEKLVELLNYGSQKWGRLRIPNPDDPNTSRWKESPLWETLRMAIEKWGNHHAGVANRVYEVKPEISEAYLRSFAGWLAGAQARVGLDLGLETAATLDEALDWFLQQATSLGELQIKANAKQQIMRILLGKKK